MPFQGWNFEKTLLIQGADEVRERELIDVRIPLDARSAGNLERDVRVAVKSDWNLIADEIPAQVYQVRRHGAVATCRVAFALTVPPGTTQRVGVFYDNPAAVAPAYPSSLQVEGDGLGGRVTTPFYAAAFSDAHGQMESLAFRMRLPNRDGTLAPMLHRAQAHAEIFLPVPDAAGSVRAVRAAPTQWQNPEMVEDIRGPVFAKRVIRGRLAPPSGVEPERCPELQVTYRFGAHHPYFLVHTRLVFPEDTPVFGVRVGGLAVEPGVFTHYTFRPVSPGLPDTDVEEMGHILIDPEHTADLPPGPALSSLIPYGIAWHGFMRAHRGLARAVTQIQLRHSVSAGFPHYRAAAYLFREPDAYACARAPVYVAKQEAANVVTVPAGAAIENIEAVVCDFFDRDWGTRTDRLGKRLNHPLAVEVHPRFMLGEIPPEDPEVLPAGVRADAYRRYGVR